MSTNNDFNRDDRTKTNRFSLDSIFKITNVYFQVDLFSKLQIYKHENANENNKEKKRVQNRRNAIARLKNDIIYFINNSIF